MDIEPLPSAPSLAVWLRNARAPYLNFLRNLTPQIFLASLTLMTASKINFSQMVLSNILPALGTLIFCLLFIFSFYSNVTLFLSELFPDFTPWVRRYENSLKASHTPRNSVPVLIIKVILRERKLEVALGLASIFMVEFVFLGVIINSVNLALSLIKATHG